MKGVSVYYSTHSAQLYSTLCSQLPRGGGSAAGWSLLRRYRLLICAPSNVAVDNLLEKVVGEGLVGERIQMNAGSRGRQPHRSRGRKKNIGQYDTREAFLLQASSSTLKRKDEKLAC